MPISPKFAKECYKINIPKLIKHYGEKFIDPFLIKNIDNIDNKPVNISWLYKSIPNNLKQEFLHEFESQYLHWDCVFFERKRFFGLFEQNYVRMIPRDLVKELEERENNEFCSTK